MRISVVVPVYNCEKYLRECIDSILNQSHRDVELILVDDESPDGCPVICDEYALRDPRIHVIHKENGGVSAARNTGIKAATGEYITFVDADDWLEQEALEKMERQMKDGVKICFANLNIRKGDVVQKMQDILPWKTILHCMLDVVNCPKKQNSLVRACWGKLYQRKLIERVFFPEKFYIGEDACFLLDVLKKLNSVEEIALCNDAVYNYRILSDSAVRRYKPDLLVQSKLQTEYIEGVFFDVPCSREDWLSVMASFSWLTYIGLLENGRKAGVEDEDCEDWCRYAEKYIRAKGVRLKGYSWFSQFAQMAHPYIGSKGLIRIKKLWNRIKPLCKGEDGNGK